MGGDNPLLGDVKREEVSKCRWILERVPVVKPVYLYKYIYDYTEDGRVWKANFFLQMLHIKINGQQPFLIIM